VHLIDTSPTPAAYELSGFNTVVWNGILFGNESVSIITNLKAWYSGYLVLIVIVSSSTQYSTGAPSPESSIPYSLHLSYTYDIKDVAAYV